jgi:hypothetical protein
MTIETDFPDVASAIATAADVEFFQDGYDIVFNRVIAPRGPNEILARHGYH